MLDLIQSGHKVKVLARDKDVLLKVLAEENWDYQVFGSHKKSISLILLPLFRNNIILLIKIFLSSYLILNINYST